MTITNTYRRLKYIVVSLLVLINSSQLKGMDGNFGGLLLPNYTISGKDIAIKTDILTPTLDNSIALQINIFNYQVRNAYLDKNGRTHNLVSYFGLIESAYMFTLLNIEFATQPNNQNSLIFWLANLMLAEKVLTNSKFHYYLKKPEITDNKLDWYCSSFFGVSSALYDGKDMNFIFNYKPEIGMRLGLNKVLKIFDDISSPITIGRIRPSNPINPFVERQSTESIGLYFDIGYLTSFDFQNGSKPMGMGNFFFCIGISSGFKLVK